MAKKNNNKIKKHKKAPPLMTLEHFTAAVDQEIEDENIDSAIDSLWLDLLGIYMDCAAIKDNTLVRQLFTTTKEGYPSWFEDVGDAYSGESKSGNPFDEEPDPTEKQEFWKEIKRTMKNSQAPLKPTTKLCKKIRQFPEREVTLYIRLDEQVPRNSCTAYEVDWDGFTLENKKDDLFTIFRLCSRRKGATRTECIVGTLASACLHPYTVVLPGNKTNAPSVEEVDGEHDPTRNDAPFRPVRVLLDRPEDVCTAELQFYLARMGLAECVEVDPELRDLHDAADLDFFPRDQGDVFMVPSVATVLENNNNNNNNNNRSLSTSGCSTSLPFICLDQGSVVET